MKRMPFGRWKVRYILSLDPGQVAQTRRAMNPQPSEGFGVVKDEHGGFRLRQRATGLFRECVKPRYQVGEIVAMGEALVARRVAMSTGLQDVVTYAADRGLVSEPVPLPVRVASWRWERNKLPSIHMPLWAARRWHRITDVRAERVQDISEEDALAEGLMPGSQDTATAIWQASDGHWCPDYLYAWAVTWNQFSRKPGLTAEDNPWTFAYAFERVEKPDG